MKRIGAVVTGLCLAAAGAAVVRDWRAARGRSPLPRDPAARVSLEGHALTPAAENDAGDPELRVARILARYAASDGSAAARAEALEALARMGRAAVDPLRRRLDVPARPLRRLAWEALARIDAPAASEEALARFPVETDPLDRRVLLSAVAGVSDAPGTALAAGVLSSAEKDAELRRLAARVLAEACLARGIPLSALARELAGAAGPALVARTLEADWLVGGVSAAPDPARAAAAFLDEPSPAVRAAWIRALAEAARAGLAEAIQTLALVASDPFLDVPLRTEALRGLAADPSAADPDWVAGLLAGEDPALAVAAVTVWVGCAPRPRLEETLADVYRSRSDPRLRARILDALAGLDGDLEEILERIWRAEEDPVRRRAILAILASGGGAETLARLAAEDPAAAEALVSEEPFPDATAWLAAYQAAPPGRRAALLKGMPSPVRGSGVDAALAEALANPSLREAILEAARGSEDPLLLAALADVALAEDAPVETRAAALRAVGAMSEAAGAADWLRSFPLSWQEEPIQAAAVEALSRFPGTANHGVAESLLAAGAAPPRVQAAAVGLLTYGEGSRAPEILASVVRATPHDAVRHAALAHLRITAGEAAYRTYAEQARAASDERTRLLAITELYRAPWEKREDAKALLREILAGGTPSETIRRAAERTLGLLEERLR